MTVRDLLDAINSAITPSDMDLPVVIKDNTAFWWARIEGNFDAHITYIDRLEDKGYIRERVLEIVHAE